MTMGKKRRWIENTWEIKGFVWLISSKLEPGLNLWLWWHNSFIQSTFMRHLLFACPCLAGTVICQAKSLSWRTWMRIETVPSATPTQCDQIWPHKREPPIHWRTQEMPHEHSVWNREAAAVCHREAGILGRDIPRQVTTVPKAYVSKANSGTQESIQWDWG